MFWGAIEPLPDQPCPPTRNIRSPGMGGSGGREEGRQEAVRMQSGQISSSTSHWLLFGISRMMLLICPPPRHIQSQHLPLDYMYKLHAGAPKMTRGMQWMEVAASLSRCSMSEARQWLSGRVFVGRARHKVFGRASLSLISGSLSGRNVSSPISSNGQRLHGADISTLLGTCVHHKVTLMELVSIST